MTRVLLFISFLILAPHTLFAAPGTNRNFVSADAGFSMFGETGNRENLFRSLSQATRGGLRWGNWGAYVHVEPAFWIAAEGKDDETWAGVLNIGLGGEYLYAKGFVRTSVTVGPSVLLMGTDIDTIGQTGFFLDIRPTGLRWQVADAIVVGLDPIALSITVPALDGIPLVEIAYRTLLSGEYLF